MTSLRYACSLLLCALFTSLAASASAANASLAQVDEMLNRWRTLDYTYRVVTSDSGGKKTTMALRMRMKSSPKGVTRQLIEIDEPADMKGTKVLTKSPTEMYIYLPAMKKVRRIASHVTEQGFLGTALSQKDMTLTRYGTHYRAVATGPRVLKLTAKSDSAPYARIVLHLAADRPIPTKIEYQSKSGKLLKTELRSRYSCAKGICTPKKMKLSDHATGVTTVLHLKKYRINPKLKASLFSKRQLLR